MVKSQSSTTCSNKIETGANMVSHDFQCVCIYIRKVHPEICFVLIQFKTPRLRVLPGGILQYGAATHAPVSRVLGDIAHAATLQPGPPYTGHSRLVPASY